ncbi:hypothetical protein AX15_004844 [Amanita polypyramis BW_CC]|nr:hypothetical protein AX15_004844 [Amanita polypyramis BW_CC]
MGSLCSKSGVHSGVHSTVPLVQRQAPTAPDLRAAAAAAAEQRLKAAQARGTHTSNPNRGKLADQLTKQTKYAPEARQEEQLVWD